MNLTRPAGYLVAITVTVVGCSRKPADQPDIAAVSGTVTMDGKPLANAGVTFESENKVLSFATTDAAGHYELTYIRTAKGAGLGRNTVRITSRMDGPPGPRWKDPIPAAYNSESTLQVDVVDGTNTHDFALQSKPAKK